MKRYKYLCLKLSNFPEDAIKKYKPHENESHNGYVYVKVRKGVYGLPQAGIIVHKLLKKRFKKHRYSQIKITPVFWKHKWLPISFSLMVDDSVVEHVGNEHVDHLIKYPKSIMTFTKTRKEAIMSTNLLTATTTRAKSFFPWFQASLEQPCFVSNTRRRFITATHEGRKDMDAGSCGHLFIRRKGSRWHYVVPTKCNCYV